jgi:hypothetical protein
MQQVSKHLGLNQKIYVLQSTMLHHLQRSQADAVLFPMTAPKDLRSPVGEKKHTKDT